MHKEGGMRRTLSVLCICLALGFYFMAWTTRTTSAGGQNAQGSKGDLPVEQTRKNIQVLKGLPESQLFPLMNFVSVSLGVRCAFCHVQGAKDPTTGHDTWIWESDDKPAKRTARSMMRMTMDLNKNYAADFRGNNITCFTCHQGHNDPIGLPPLPLTASGHEPPSPGGAGAPTPRPTPPTPEQILDKYTQAIGGRDAAAKLQTRVMRGLVEQSQGRMPAIEITMKGSDKLLVVITAQDHSVTTQSFNGSKGWSKNSRGMRELTPDEVAQFRRAAELYNVVGVTQPASDFRFGGRRQVGDHEAYVLRGKAPDGRAERLYFDTQTGLLLRKQFVMETMLVPIPEQIDYEDYRDVDGVKLPFTIRVSNIDTFNSSTRKFTEVKGNVPVDDSLFNMPASNKP